MATLAYTLTVLAVAGPVRPPQAGSPAALPAQGRQDVTATLERFMAKVDTSGGVEACHLWTACKTAGGYGYFRVSGGVRTYAHRWILGHVRGHALEKGEHALHKCDNPTCVNPLHLYVGDHKRNMRDAVERGRMNMDGLALGRQPGKTLGVYRTGTELCGTVRGYSRHLRHGEESCQPCRDAVAAYHRMRSARRVGR
jgi:hypothetical protein